MLASIEHWRSSCSSARLPLSHWYSTRPHYSDGLYDTVTRLKWLDRSEVYDGPNFRRILRNISELGPVASKAANPLIHKISNVDLARRPVAAFEAANSGAFVAYPSRWRRVRLSLIGVAFVVAGLWMIGAFGAVPVSGHNSHMETVISGWLTLIVFGVFSIASIPWLFETGEQLRIDAIGIRYSPWSPMTIPWSEIRAVTIWSVDKSRAIILHLRQPRAFPGKGLAAVMARANRRLTGGEISISMAGMDRSHDDAVAAISRFRPPLREPAR